MRERDLSATGTVLRPRGGSRTGSSERASHPRCGTEPGDGSARRGTIDGLAGHTITAKPQLSADTEQILAKLPPVAG